MTEKPNSNITDDVMAPNKNKIVLSPNDETQPPSPSLLHINSISSSLLRLVDYDNKILE